jgi:hypothetical protein
VKLNKTMTQDIAKLIKNASKEGAKLGMDLTGAAELGGTEFFVTTCQGAEGNMEALLKAKEALLEECTIVGVILLSAGKDLACTCSVPEDKADQIAADVWLATAIKAVGGEVAEGASKTYAQAVITPKEGEFAIKLKDAVLAAGVQLLREKGKIPEDNSDDEDDICYGDDDLGTW